MYLNDTHQDGRRKSELPIQRRTQRRVGDLYSDYAVPKMFRNNSSRSKRSQLTRKATDSCSDVTNLCTIDPLESTDSMVCAFASVANVIEDDASDCYDENEDDLRVKTNDYIIEVMPNSGSIDGNEIKYSEERSSNTDVESESHFYETIYPLKSKLCCDLRTEANNNVLMTQSYRNCLYNVPKSDDLLIIKANHCVNEQKASIHKFTDINQVNKQHQERQQERQQVDSKVKSILKESSHKEMHCDSDARRKSEVSSSIASSTQTSRLQPDQMYPGYGSDFNGNKSISSKQSRDTYEIDYAVIVKNECKNAIGNGDCKQKSVDECSASNEPVNCQKMGVDRNGLIKETKNCDETKQHSSKSFLQKISGFKKAISRAFSADKVSKSKKDEAIPSLTTSYSVPSLAINNKQTLSVERLTTTNSEPELTEPKSSFVKSLKNRMSLRRKPPKIKVKVDIDKNKTTKNEEKKLKNKSNQLKDAKLDVVWGELKQLHSNGSQVIELHRPVGKPFGFFVARGTVNNIKGVFVSRMRDEEIQKTLNGLLEIGDEIIAIDGVNVKNSTIVQVNQLMAHKTKITLHVIPYVNHKYR